MSKNEIVLKPSYWASVSGGKDSLFMLKLILSNLDKYPLNGVVHFELEIDYPFIKEVINYMEAECIKHNIKFIRIKPETSWNDLYNKLGFPTRKARWCLSNYKLNCKKQLNNFLKSQGAYLISYIGYCVDEYNRYNKRNTYNEVYPLVNENIKEEIILEWARTQPIFNNFYKYNKRCGCMYCPMGTMREHAYLLKYYPENYEYMMRLARATELMREKELNRPFSIWESNPKYNTEYRDNIIRNKYIYELDE